MAASSTNQAEESGQAAASAGTEQAGWLAGSQGPGLSYGLPILFSHGLWRFFFPL